MSTSSSEFAISFWFHYFPGCYYLNIDQDCCFSYKNFYGLSIVCGWVFSLIITRICSSLLNRVYAAHRKYAYKYKRTNDVRAKELLTDEWEISKIKCYFAYYFTSMCFFWLFHILSIYFLNRLERMDMWHWLYCLMGCWAWDLIICDFIIVC